MTKKALKKMNGNNINVQFEHFWGLFKYRKGPARVSQVKNSIDIKGVIFLPNLMYMQYTQKAHLK